MPEKTVARLITNTQLFNTDSNVMFTHSPLTFTFVCTVTTFVLTTEFPLEDCVLVRPKSTDVSWSRCIDGYLVQHLVGDDLPHISRRTPMLSLFCLIIPMLHDVKRHDLRETVCDLLTVTMYFQNVLTKLHGPQLHEVGMPTLTCRMLRV